jgi:hypothetical protein
MRCRYGGSLRIVGLFLVTTLCWPTPVAYSQGSGLALSVVPTRVTSETPQTTIQVSNTDEEV